MMDARQLDRAIDAAAGEMMAREPSRSLGYDVMVRVREGAAPTPRPLVWMTAAASLVLCAVIAIVMINLALAPLFPVLPEARTIVVGQPPVAIVPPMTTAQEAAAPLRRVSGAPLAPRIATHAVTSDGLPSNDVSPIAPIETEPIVLAAIDVPQLEREATSIEALTIEPLTIEPLTASND
jgi:hypothetical protein